jgi:hypothetical protein
LQHHPISPFIAKWSRPILDGSFDSKPIETYLIKHPRSRRFPEWLDARSSMQTKQWLFDDRAEYRFRGCALHLNPFPTDL